MRILVLGASGFVGRNVLEAFEDSGNELVPASRRSGLDLTDLAATEDRVAAVRPDVVVNCAADVGSLNYVTEKAAGVVDRNLRMLLNLYRAVADGAPRAVVVNPVANCGFPGDLEVYREDLFWAGEPHRSVLSYGSTRRVMMVLAWAYGLERGVRSVSFYVPNMYGPHDSTDPNKAHALNALVSKVVRAKAEGRPDIEVWGTGTPVREWLYAPDFARVVRDAVARLDSEPFDEPVNVGQRHGWSVREIVEVVVREAGFQGRVVWDPSKPDGAPRKVMDDARFRRLWPDFRFTDLREGVRRTIVHYESLWPW